MILRTALGRYAVTKLIAAGNATRPSGRSSPPRWRVRRACGRTTMTSSGRRADVDEPSTSAREEPSRAGGRGARWM